MKICSAVCEYNPLHNGHIKHLNYIKEKVKPDYTVVFLSGNFTQRGELAVCDKYTRATWAIMAGADAVIELPTVFATATAEIFGGGAMKLVNSLPYNKSVCFGTESDNLGGLIELAGLMLNETDDMKKIIKSELDKGEPLLKARITAAKKYATQNVDLSYLDSPNNVLGLEYVKAINKNNYDIEINTLVRSGGDYLDDNINNDTPSALAIRTAITSGNLDIVKNKLPSYVLNDLPSVLPSLDNEILYAIRSSDKEQIKNTLECAEGLENRIKSLSRDCVSFNELLSSLKTKRYTDARLRRILLATTLKIDGNFVKECLNGSLYLKVLAINKQKSDVLSVLANSNYPIITKKRDADNLIGIALKCFEKDLLANDIYSLATGEKIKEYQIKLV